MSFEASRPIRRYGAMAARVGGTDALRSRPFGSDGSSFSAMLWKHQAATYRTKARRTKDEHKPPRWSGAGEGAGPSQQRVLGLPVEIGLARPIRTRRGSYSPPVRVVVFDRVARLGPVDSDSLLDGMATMLRLECQPRRSGRFGSVTSGRVGGSSQASLSTAIAYRIASAPRPPAQKQGAANQPPPRPAARKPKGIERSCRVPCLRSGPWLMTANILAGRFRISVSAKTNNTCSHSKDDAIESIKWDKQRTDCTPLHGRVIRSSYFHHHRYPGTIFGREKCQNSSTMPSSR